MFQRETICERLAIAWAILIAKPGIITFRNAEGLELCAPDPKRSDALFVGAIYPANA
jgi:hypothetical protein